MEGVEVEDGALGLFGRVLRLVSDVDWPTPAAHGQGLANHFRRASIALVNKNTTNTSWIHLKASVYVLSDSLQA